MGSRESGAPFFALGSTIGFSPIIEYPLSLNSRPNGVSCGN